MTEYKPATGQSWRTALDAMGVQVTMPERGTRNCLVDTVNPAHGEHVLEFEAGTGSTLISPCPKATGTAVSVFRHLATGSL